MTTVQPIPEDEVRDGADNWLLRFDGVERALHWTSAALFLVLIVTGAALYFTPLIAAIGRRALVERVHVYCGLALPVPFLLALGGSWGRNLRADLRRLNRWSSAEARWLRTSLFKRRPSALRLGKFNPGQKLNAAFIAGAGMGMLMSGVILFWYRPFPLSWREGATFVHNWGALALVVVIAAHIGMALSHPRSLRSMITGRVERSWARLHAPLWLEEVSVPSSAANRAVAGKGSSSVS
jgi:formate dehydrogenase subunit gamma